MHSRIHARWVLLAAAAGLASLVMAGPSWGQAKPKPKPLEAVIEEIAQHMLTAFPLRAPKNHLAIMQYIPTAGQPRRLGDNLMQKVRVRMFDLDKDHQLNFVSQGKVTELLVSQGAESLREIYDGKRRVELGRLLTADHFVYGTYEMFQDGSAEIISYLVEIESGLIRAQRVAIAEGIPSHLLQPAAAGSQAASADTPVRAYRFGSSALKSNPEAAKKFRMAELFEERGRNDRVAAIYGEILAEYPNSLEAMNVQARNLGDDVQRLTAEGRYDEQLFAAYKSLPLSYASSPRSRNLHAKIIAWQVAVGLHALDEGNMEQAKSFFDRARQLGLPESEHKALRERLGAKRRSDRSETIRAHLLRGDRDQAEALIVEWEAEESDHPMVKQIKKEFDRREGMATVPGAEVSGRTVDSFNMDLYETTNREFLEFIKANPEFQRGRVTDKVADKDYLLRWTEPLAFPSEIGNRPVVFVSQPVAEAYCKWRNKRLPTSDEWGLAAGEGRRKYPWGDQEPNDDIANFNRNLVGEPLPGPSHPKGRTPEGIYHMGGNVWELTSTKTSTHAVSRGGCYYDPPEFLLSNYRGTRTRDVIAYTSRFMGFRCAQ
jgi:tetratricopeptide (TPR) repeat protein